MTYPEYGGQPDPRHEPTQYGQPQYDPSQYGQPQYGQPEYGQPQYGQPEYGQSQYGAYPPPPAPPNRGPQIIAVVAAVIALAAVAAVVLLFVNSRGDDSDTADGGETVVTQYVSTPPSADDDAQVRQAPAPAPATPSSSTPQLPVPSVPGTGVHGFAGGPTCDDNADPLVFVGYSSRSKVIICQVGQQTGRYYYKGLADGNSRHVDFPTRSGNTFTATNGNVSYIVSPASLVITENGRVLTTEPMLSAWVN